MDDRSVTIEFTITGLTDEAQKEVLDEILLRLVSGDVLLNVYLPDIACYEDGKVEPMMTCSISPPPEQLVPSAIVSCQDPDCRGVVVKVDAESALVQALEDKEGGPRKSERLIYRRGQFDRDGSFLVVNEPVEESRPGRFRRRRRPRYFGNVLRV